MGTLHLFIVQVQKKCVCNYSSFSLFFWQNELDVFVCYFSSKMPVLLKLALIFFPIPFVSLKQPHSFFYVLLLIFFFCCCFCCCYCFRAPSSSVYAQHRVRVVLARAIWEKLWAYSTIYGARLFVYYLHRRTNDCRCRYHCHCHCYTLSSVPHKHKRTRILFC